MNIPPYSMDSHQHAALTRMFEQRRLMPWVPEHKVFIDGQLAMLKVTNEHDYNSAKDFYDKLLKNHQEEVGEEPVDVVKANVPDVLPPVPTVELPPAAVESFSAPEVEEKVVEKPKKGRPKKN